MNNESQSTRKPDAIHSIAGKINLKFSIGMSDSISVITKNASAKENNTHSSNGIERVWIPGRQMQSIIHGRRKAHGITDVNASET